MVSRAKIAQSYRESGAVIQAEVVSVFDDNPAYITRDLTEVPPKNLREFKDTLSGEPGHWFGLYTIPETDTGVRAIQFGIGRPEHVRSFQEVLLEIAAKNGAQATVMPYARFGGFVVREVNKAGHSIFAAIEVNSVEISEDESLLFARLGIPRALMKTRDIFKEMYKNTPQSRLSGWERKIANSRHNDDWKVAELIAYSAIAAAGVSEARPVY